VGSWIGSASRWALRYRKAVALLAALLGSGFLVALLKRAVALEVVSVDGRGVRDGILGCIYGDTKDGAGVVCT